MITFKGQRLLIIAPHPDDEILGCGGLIKKVKDAGGKVYVLFLTVGVTMDYSEHGISTGKERLDEVEQVAKYMKYDNYRFAFFGDDYHLKLDVIPQKDVTHEIESGKDISLNKTKPTIVATPLLSDYNQDHTMTTRSVFTATRPAPPDTKPFQPTILGYESVPTANWWNPAINNVNFFVGLSEKDLEVKLAGLNFYKSQVRQEPHPRSHHAMRSLAHYRGMQAGKKAAEAFYIYRHTT